jgi:hypothetical protein
MRTTVQTTYPQNKYIADGTKKLQPRDIPINPWSWRGSRMTAVGAHVYI